MCAVVLFAYSFFSLNFSGQFDRVAGWFNVEFTRGGHRVVLDTSPSMAATHWMQMVFHLDAPRFVEKKQRVTGMVDIGGFLFLI